MFWTMFLGILETDKLMGKNYSKGSVEVIARIENGFLKSKLNGTRLKLSTLGQFQPLDMEQCLVHRQ